MLFENVASCREPQGPEQAKHLALQVDIVLIHGMDLLGWTFEAGIAQAGEHGADDPFAQGQQSGEDAHSARADAEVSGVIDALHKPFAARFCKTVKS